MKSGKDSLGNPSDGVTQSHPVSSGNTMDKNMDMKDGSKQGSMEHHQMVKVSGNCEQCKKRIETAAKSVAGVVSAEWNVTDKMLHLQFDASKTNLDTIQKAVAKAGHDTEKFKAPDEVYSKLPECCLNRK
jgi:Cu(I)/Ag(I) efflux system membrane fusion protein